VDVVEIPDRFALVTVLADDEPAMRAQACAVRIDENGAVFRDPGGSEQTVEVIIKPEVLVAEAGVVRLGQDIELEGVPLVEESETEIIVLDDAQVEVEILADDERLA
jgi:hypothetical protein